MQIHLYIPDQWADALDRIKQEQHVSRSALVRDAVRCCIEGALDQRGLTVRLARQLDRWPTLDEQIEVYLNER